MAVRRLAVLAVVAAALGAGAQTSSAASSIHWQPCSRPTFDRWKSVDGATLTGFDCAAVVRPLDRARPGGAQVRLAVVRLPATGPPSQRKGTLFHNPGGPGQSGLGLSIIVDLLPPEIRASFDFVTYDPRGIGASLPAIQGPGCNIPKPARPATGPVDWARVLRTRQHQAASHNARCFAGNRRIVEHAGTVDGAYDLDALRAAVGDPKITYWGISYGTLLGSTYAQLFPGRVRALVFDGNMDPQISLYGISTGAQAPDHSIGFFLQANPALRVKYDAIMRRLDRRVLALPGGPTYTRWDLLDVLNDDVPFFIDPGGDWATAREAIETAYTGIFGSGDAQHQAQRKLAGNPNLRSPSTGTVGSLWSAVVCQDFADRISDDRQQRRLKWLIKEAPIYGGSLGVDYLTTCNGYGGARPQPVPRPRRYGPDVHGIVANATRDGETPYQWAVNMARTYRGMRMLTLVGGIHGTFGLSESSCVDSTIAQYLITTTLPAVDLTCPYVAPPGFR
jgi:pimeloyl-ACP methyl ester carboxylesterase